jgi:hypothetical protein
MKQAERFQFTGTDGLAIPGKAAHPPVRHAGPSSTTLDTDDICWERLR